MRRGGVVGRFGSLTQVPPLPSAASKNVLGISPLAYLRDVKLQVDPIPRLPREVSDPHRRSAASPQRNCHTTS